jgi:methylase of polypeptide subunit release factors
MFTAEILQDWNPAPFREALTEADYTRTQMEKAGIYRPGEPAAREELANRLLPEDSPLLTACRLFDHGVAVTRQAAQELFGPGFDGLLKIGLLEASGERVRSAAKIEASHDGWFAFDHPAALSAGKPDYVMGEGNSSKMLAALATSAKGERVLDLGTGAGWGALRLAERGCLVTATDFNPRAIGFARFNARLAGLENRIEFLTGDRFEPVAGRRFDAIASNPPFVISPENTFIFRDGGVTGDGFCESLARNFGDHLEEGGIAVMILNWYDTGEEIWNQRPLEWARDSGCDVWLFRSDRHDPADYGFRWLRESLQGRSPSPAELTRWTGYYDTLGADGINLGFLAMGRRSNGENWTRSDSRSTVKVIDQAGAEIRQIFTNQSWLATRNPGVAELLDLPFIAAPGMQTEVTMLLEEGWNTRSIKLRSHGQLAYDGQIDSFIMRLLEICSQGGTPRHMLEEVSANPEFAGAEQLDVRVAQLARELVRLGLLLPPPAVQAVV